MAATAPWTCTTIARPTQPRRRRRRSTGQVRGARQQSRWVGPGAGAEPHHDERFLEYHPTVLQRSARIGSRSSTSSTGMGPYNAWLDPLVIDEWQKMAYVEIEAMTKRGVPGVVDPRVLRRMGRELHVLGPTGTTPSDGSTRRLAALARIPASAPCRGNATSGPGTVPIRRCRG